VKGNQNRPRPWLAFNKSSGKPPERKKNHVRSHESGTNPESETGLPAGEAVITLTKATDGTQALRWIEFPAAVLLFVIVAGDPQSGAVYVLERKTGTWLWVDFEDEQCGGCSIGDFDLLMQEYDFLSLVERPALLRIKSGWVLDPGKPAEMAGGVSRSELCNGRLTEMES
jgi:hypothetical protein